VTRNSKINLTVAVAAVAIWTLVRLATTGGEPALGQDGAAVEQMVRGYTLKGGDEPTRLSPLMPILAWIPFAATGDVVTALNIVNGLAMGALVLGAGMLMDRRSSDPRWKAVVALTMPLCILYGKQAAFAPASPYLCGVAALTLAMAVSAERSPVAAGAAQMAAVMALPVGLLAPLYGFARSVRARSRDARAVLVSAAAFATWLLVQWWGRGGVAGVIEDYSPGALFRDTAMWRAPLFLTTVWYFFVTAAGGLSLTSCCRPWSWTRLVRRSPESIALACAVLVCAIASPTSAVMLFGFLTPVWVLLVAEWSGEIDARRVWWWVAATVAITLVTQRPWTHVDATTALIDWHPYDVYRRGTNVRAEDLWEVWVPRIAVAGVALWLVSIAGRQSAFVGGEADAGDLHRAGDLHEDVTRRPTARAGAAASAGLARYSVANSDSVRWSVLAYGYAIVLAGVTAYFLFGLPVQLTDSFANLMAIQAGSVADVFTSQLHGGDYLRPLLQTQLKIVYEVAHGNYFAWYRGVQAVQVVIALWLSVRLLEPRRLADAAIVPCALAMVLGIHTFAGTILEAFPINTFLTIVLCCLAAANLARTRGGWLVDVAASVLLAFSVLTVESGVLVFIVLVASRIAGERGVSIRGLALATVVLGGYFAMRAYLDVGVPGFNERPTGFGFRVLEPADAMARFADHPWPFYLYNYLSAILTVLFAEPRGGVWNFVAAVLRGSLPPWEALNVITCTLTTGVLVWYIARRVPSWMRRRVDRDDGLVLVFLAVLAANALLCVVYVKDVIMSPAGVFYALAAATAIRSLVMRTNVAMRRHSLAWTVALLALISTGWAWKLLGIHYALRDRAAMSRSEWAYEDEWEVNNHIVIRTPEASVLRQTLVDDAIWRRPAPPQLDSRWDPFFDRTQ
jgi:hypothetical protein